MPFLIAFLSLLTVASAAATIIFRRKGQSFNGMLFKFLSSFGFMSVAFVGFCDNTDCNPYFFCLVLFALMFGLGGDILLGLKEIAPKFRSRLVAMGTGSFLLGHIFFLWAFILVIGFSIIPFIVMVVMTIACLAFVKIAKLEVDKKLAILLSIYYAVLCAKLTYSLVGLILTKQKAFISTTIGCILFLVSDSVLALLYFTPVKSKNKLVTIELGTYYPAQILLALSVALI